MKINLTLSGPFLTTKILDPQRLGGTSGNISLLRAAYIDVQGRLSNCLSEAEPGWKRFGGAAEADTDYDGKSYSGSAIFPERLAECMLSNVQIAEAVNQWTVDASARKFSDGAVCGLTVSSGTLTFDRCTISIHDFGVGIVEIDVTFAGLGTVTVGDIRSEMEALTVSFASLSSLLAGQRLKTFLRCLDQFPDVGRIFTTMSPGTSGQYSNSRPKVLWIHRIYLVNGNNWLGTDDALAALLLVQHHTNGCENASIDPTISLYPSIGGSVAFAKEGQDQGSLGFGDALKSTVSLQNAYNAGIWMFDDILFGRTVELMGEQDQIVFDNVKLEGLMSHAHSILRLSSYISTFLSVLHNRTSRSSPQQLILTEKIYDAWRMELQRAALESKLAVLKEMYQVTLRLLADAEARALNKLLFWFTLLSLVTATTTVADFIVKMEEFRFSGWRLSLVIGSAAVVYFAVLAVRKFKHLSAMRHLNDNADVIDRAIRISTEPYRGKD